MSPLYNRGCGFALGNRHLREWAGSNKAKVFCEKRSEALGLPTNQIAAIWWVLTGDWRSLNLHVRGKETKRLPPVEGITTFFHLSLTWCKFLLAREWSRWDRQVGSYCPFVAGSRAHLHPVWCIWHPALLQSSIPPSLLRVQLQLCTVPFTSSQLINCYWTFHTQCLCSPLSVCILPTWQSRSALCFSFISPSVPLSQCQIAQVANTDRECFTTITEGFNYWLEVSFQDYSEQSFFSSLLK